MTLKGRPYEQYWEQFTRDMNGAPGATTNSMKAMMSQESGINLHHRTSTKTPMRSEKNDRKKPVGKPKETQEDNLDDDTELGICNWKCGHYTKLVGGKY